MLELYRDGKLVRTLPDGYGAPTIVIPVPEEPLGVAATLDRGLPAHVLTDKYNPKYEHYFPLLEHKRDIYRRVSEGRYEYECTESVFTRDYR